MFLDFGFGGECVGIYLFLLTHIAKQNLCMSSLRRRIGCFVVCVCFGMSRAPSPTTNFKIFRRGDSRIARFCSRYAFVFFEMSRAPSPTGWFFVCENLFVFSGRPGGRPLQKILNFSVGANCVRPPCKRFLALASPVQGEVAAVGRRKGCGFLSICLG